MSTAAASSSARARTSTRIARRSSAGAFRRKRAASFPSFPTKRDPSIFRASSAAPSSSTSAAAAPTARAAASSASRSTVSPVSPGSSPSAPRIVGFGFGAGAPPNSSRMPSQGDRSAPLLGGAFSFRRLFSSSRPPRAFRTSRAFRSSWFGKGEWLAGRGVKNAPCRCSAVCAASSDCARSDPKLPPDRFICDGCGTYVARDPGVAPNPVG
mmetsp:Transcript_13060/g.54849  ORF Transcript_13060/g.54849 Transcript_13060/m.54849 type:complete len:211 (+) Transcript_13060:850-1482(+)